MGFANVDYNIVNLDVDDLDDDLDDGLDDGTYFRNDIGLLNFDLDDDDTINLIIRLITLCKRYYQCKRWSNKKKKKEKKTKTSCLHMMSNMMVRLVYAIRWKRRFKTIVRMNGTEKVS